LRETASWVVSGRLEDANAGLRARTGHVKGFEEVHRMNRVAGRMIALAMVVVGLAGCEAAGAPPGTPGSMTAYVHGQTVGTVGAVTR